MRILLIDNYDSFTYNIVHYLRKNGAEVEVFFNNEIPFEKMDSFDRVVLSPGPGLPIDSGDLMLFIEKFHNKIPMLGVCLGFQALLEFFGGTLLNQKVVKHGVKESCFFDNASRMFNGTPEKFNVGLYHSWCANEEDFPKELTITSRSEHNVIMAFEHVNYPVYGVQFHPESILTENGMLIINNFLKIKPKNP
ncbi:MAG: anthranilate synthase component II [Putridiphycobacter sp.]